MTKTVYDWVLVVDVKTWGQEDRVMESSAVSGRWCWWLLPPPVPSQVVVSVVTLQSHHHNMQHSVSLIVSTLCISDGITVEILWSQLNERKTEKCFDRSLWPTKPAVFLRWTVLVDYYCWNYFWTNFHCFLRIIWIFIEGTQT